MKCSNPRRVFDKSTAGSMLVKCGSCIACRLNYASMWATRLMNEKKYHDKTCFLTITYDDKNLIYNEGSKTPTLCKTDVQKFLKRLRKNTGKKIRYYLAGEYGENFSRPHYHAIIFGLGAEDEKEINESWNKGFIYVGNVTDDSCNYVAKYVVKKLNGDKKVVYEEKGVISEFAVMSRRPGIGSEFVEDYRDEIYNRGYMITKGKKRGIPRYYVEKIYNNEIRMARREKELGELFKENYKKELDNVKELGYDKSDKQKVDRREGLKNKLEGRFGLKRRK